MIRKVTAISAVVVLGLAGLAAGVEASGPHQTPGGYCGAMNMAASDTMTNFATGPMSHDGTPGLSFFELQGNVGMFNAVAVSDCR